MIRRFASLLVPALALLLLLVLAPASVSADADTSDTAAPKVRIVRVWTAHHTAKDFVRIGESLDGEEETGDAIVLRTQPDTRDGYYFTVRLKTARGHTLPAASIALQVVAPDADAPRTFNFSPPSIGKRSAHFELGVTGSDWPHGGSQPLAWKIDVLDSAGNVLATRESFLWQKPHSPASDS